MKIKWKLLFLFIIIQSCQDSKLRYDSPAFYHWKKDCIVSEKNRALLDTLKVKKIFLRYFDIIHEERTNSSKPTYYLDTVDLYVRKLDITPVIFIENEAMRKTEDVKDLANKIHILVDEMSNYHFEKTLPRLQLDCDWTQSSRFNYFELLNYLSSDFDLEVTIRLHQIKYPEKTGIPPVKRGILMLYNIGDLRDMKTNSILTLETTKKYIVENTTYPLELSLALPWFSQTVIRNNKDNVKIINGNHSTILSESNEYFDQTGPNMFTVIKDTTFKSFSLSQGFEIKVENSDIKEIIDSRDHCLNSRLDIRDIIIYHLDSSLDYKQLNLLFN